MFWFNFAGSMLVSGNTPMRYIGEDDTKFEDEISVSDYMQLPEDEKKNWAIVDLEEIDDFDEIELDLENCSIEKMEEVIE